MLCIQIWTKYFYHNFSSWCARGVASNGFLIKTLLTHHQAPPLWIKHQHLPHEGRLQWIAASPQDSSSSHQFSSSTICRPISICVLCPCEAASCDFLQRCPHEFSFLGTAYLEMEWQGGYWGFDSIERVFAPPITLAKEESVLRVEKNQCNGCNFSSYPIANLKNHMYTLYRAVLTGGS